MILPPGTILQQMYFKERLRALPTGRFVEVGAGQGIVSRTLLDLGWTGTAYDLNGESLAIAAQINRPAVAAGRFDVMERNWFDAAPAAPVDLIVSCMVLEHMSDADESRYFEQCKLALRPGGSGVLFVPGDPRHWGIEDEIAGHFRRYTFEGLRRRIEEHGLTVRHLAGLTFPVSNLLYPLSEYLVRRAERNKMRLAMAERTRLSGNRAVPFKTTFPALLRLVLNETLLYPFHVLQKLSARNERSLVVYAEFATPI
jgi:SAM-dependent methyltransferase